MNTIKKPGNHIGLWLFVIITFLSVNNLYAQQRPVLGAAGQFAVLAGNDLENNNQYYTKGLIGYTSLSGHYSVADTFINEDLYDEALMIIPGVQNSLFNENDQIPLNGLDDNDEITKGIYTLSSTTISAASTITLEGEENDVIIFNITGNLTIGNTVQFVLDGIKAYNVFFNVSGGLSISNNCNLEGIFISTGNISTDDDITGSFSLLSLGNIVIEPTSSLSSEKYLITSDEESASMVCVESCPQLNLITNGNFNGPTHNFLTDFSYASSGPNPGPGHYSIQANSKAYYSNWKTMLDPTVSGGKFMVIDGYKTNGTNLLWGKQVSVTPGKTYRFIASFASLSLFDYHRAKFKIEVNGVVQLTYAIPLDIYWHTVCFDWTAPTGTTTATIYIRQDSFTEPQDPYGLGDDYGIDNISFGEVLPNAGTGQDFTFEKFDNCEGTAVTFTNLFGCDAGPFTWQFGDYQTQSTAAPVAVNHNYNLPGYYMVRMTAHNHSNPITISKLIYIIPSTITYNNNCCHKNYSWTDPNDFDITSSSSPKSNPIHWTATKKIKGTVTVKSGAGLIIDPSVTINFGPQGKIIVEPGAELKLNGCTLTGINNTYCNSSGERMMWQGVEVWGDPTTTSSQNQGKITMINNATIEDAYNAIIIGKPVFSIDPAKGWFEWRKYDMNFSGGLFDINDANFNRNANSVVVWSSPFFRVNKIQNSNFTSKSGSSDAQLLDPYIYDGYVFKRGASENYYAYTMPHLYYSEVIFNEDPHGSLSGIFAFERNTIYTYLNIFENSLNGIYNHGSKIAIRNSDFYRIKKSVRSLPSTSGQNNTTLSNCTFEDDHYNTLYHVGLAGEAFPNIVNSTFNGEDPLNNRRGGIKLTTCPGFSIKDNEFNSATFGVIISSSPNTASSSAGLIGFSSNGNVFNACTKPISTDGNNMHVKIRCNTFNNDPSEFSERNWEVIGKLGNQGMADPTGSTPSAKNPAGNIFGPNTPATNQIYAPTTNTFQYYTHKDAFTKVQKEAGSNFGINENNVFFQNASVSCSPPVVNPSDPIGSIKDHLSARKVAKDVLIGEYETLFTTLNQGQTNFLLEEIYSFTDEQSLQTTLVNNSPLSDEVLIALLDLETPISDPDVLTQIFNLNLPASEAVWTPTRETALRNLYGDNQVDTWLALQGNNTSARTLTTINREIISIEEERQILKNDLVAEYDILSIDEETDYSEDINELLLQESSSSARKTLIGSYLEQGMTSEAATELQNLTIANNEDQAFYDLYMLYVDLKENNKTIWDLDSPQKALVYSIAEMCPISLATINAQALIQVVYTDTIPDCPANNYRKNISKTTSVNSIGNLWLSENIPNPFHELTRINYQLPPKTQRAELIITDLAGKEIEKAELDITGKTFIYKNKLISMPGMYFYSLVADGKVLAVKKMIVIQ